MGEEDSEPLLFLSKYDYLQLLKSYKLQINHSVLALHLRFKLSTPEILPDPNLSTPEIRPWRVRRR